MLDQKSRIQPSGPSVYRPNHTTMQSRPATAHSASWPPAYRPQDRIVPVQMKGGPASPPAYRPLSAIQLKPCAECGKAKGHLSSCSRHKNRRGVVRSEQQTKNKENSSWRNMKKYRPGWVTANDITEQSVKAFCKQYSVGKIRGHASEDGDTDQKEQANTTLDLTAYKGWHTRTYGVWH